MLLYYTINGCEQILDEEFGKLDDIRLTKIQIKQHYSTPMKIAHAVARIQDDRPLSRESIMIVWSRYEIFELANLINTIPVLDIDHLLFPHLDMELDVGWVVGQPNALIKWGATCMDAYAIDEQVWPVQKSTMSGTALLIWWAQRINLKVFGLVS